MLTHEPTAFPNLRHLIFNDWSVLLPVFRGNKSDLFERQKSHLNIASKTRQTLESVTFGTAQWRRECPSGAWYLTEGQTIPVRSPENSIFEPIEDLAIFWGDIVYDEPPSLLSINWDFLSEDHNYL